MQVADARENERRNVTWDKSLVNIIGRYMLLMCSDDKHIYLFLAVLIKSNDKEISNFYRLNQFNVKTR